MPGKILQLDVEEGIQLKQGQLVGLVDTVLLQKQKNVIAATIRSIDSKTQSQAPEIEVLTEQRSYLLTEKKRVIKLIEEMLPLKNNSMIWNPR